MRSSFRGYYRPTTEEFQTLWKEAEIVLDANVLLNLYRYSIATRLDLLKLLEDLEDRLWLPHQAALEYQRNRIDVMCGERDAYSRIRKAIGVAESSVREAFREHSRHLILDTDESSPVVEAAFKTIADHVTEKEALHPDMPEGVAPGDMDKVRDKLTELFEGRVGQPHTPEQLEALYSEGEQRYEAQIPPGFKDGGKPGERQFGDLLIWKQVIDHAKLTKRPVLFITDEKKDDWWMQTRGQIVLPRPELVEEFWQEAAVPFYMYRSSTFMDRARAEIGSSVTAEAVKEVEAVADRHEAMERQLSAHREDIQLRANAALSRLSRTERRLQDLRGRQADAAKTGGPGVASDELVKSVRAEAAELESMLAQVELNKRHAEDSNALRAAEIEAASVRARLARLQVEFELLHSTTPVDDLAKEAENEQRIRRLEAERAGLFRQLANLEAEAVQIDRLLGEA